MRRLLVIVCCCCGLGFAAPAAADGAGGPVPPQQAGAGVSAPGSNLAYIAVPAGRSTVIERLRRGDGMVERTRLLAGRWGVPGVAYDGSATGLSAETLVLADARPIYPVKRTRLVLLRARNLRPFARITLTGWFTVDAISPDGRWMYLIHYLSVSDTNRYEVRAYDLRARRLVSKPVIDPREADEKMQGIPVTRVMSADGRWAYTLYQRPSEAPFIHALDTQGRTARCIDLDDVSDDDLGEARLALVDGGATLRVAGQFGALALVDTRTFAARKPGAPRSVTPRPAGVPHHAASGGGGGLPWELALVALVPLAGLFVVVRRRRRAAVR